MKNLIKIITIFILIFAIFGTISVNAGIEGLNEVQGLDKITDQSIEINTASGNISDDIQNTGYKILTMVKYIVSALLVVFIVYIGIQMVLSMGNDEEELGKAKKQLRYTIMGLLFINIPFQLYSLFDTKKGQAIDGGVSGTWGSDIAINDGSNIIVNITNFNQTINGGVILFIEAVIFSVAIFIIILSGLKIMSSRGKEEQITESKNKIIWSLVGLAFIGFIESWQELIFNGKIEDGATMFNTIENLALFFAGPVAIFFLTLAGYYYITANGDEEKTKKAKSIIINTIIATVILMASHAFLSDLQGLTF